MKIDIIEYARINKVPRSSALRAVLKNFAGWRDKSWGVESPNKDTYSDGFTFGRTGNICFILPVKKAKSIILDTELSTILMDDVVLLDVS